MIRSHFSVPGALALLLAACGQQGPVANNADESAALPSVNQGASDPSGAAPPPGTTTGTGAMPAAPAAAIPAGFHGRWGMAPADCTTTRGDAKGLLTIDRGGLKFYESRALPATNVNTSSDSFSADFAFTGEGQQWTRFETLELQDGKLVRTESGPMASYTYVRCD